MIDSPILYALAPYLAYLAFAWRRTLTYLHIFQQEEYDSPRFQRWLKASKAWDVKVSVGLFLLTLAASFIVPKESAIWGFNAPAIAMALTALFIAAFFIEKDPRKTGKKPLAMTQRAKRILLLAFTGTILVTLPLTFGSAGIFAWLIAVHILPYTLPVATLALKPYDDKVNAGFRQEAVAILNKLSPYIIGVTGSYGKTSVKHILGHILNMQAPTLVTPGSVNTEMGIARIVREQLNARHKYFVVEMGAYGIGSIARLCAFTPPSLGIITAIGQAHYERFKTLEDTATAKLELAQSVAAQNGKVVIAEPALTTTYAARYAAGNRKQLVIVGQENTDVAVKDVTQTPDGLDVTLLAEGQTVKLSAPLYGRHHGMNVALAFAAARQLGVSVEDIAAALVTVPQITHRLEVKRTGTGITIDDAYNSNPEGFASALELLKLLKTHHKGRGILVTPGMVELGDAHDAEHAKLGTLAGLSADIVLAVVPERIPTFTANAGPAEVIAVPSFAKAQEWLNANLKPNDVVLLENDLPDLFEKKLKL